MKESEKKGWFWYWGLKIYQFRWFVAAFWILLFIVSAAYAQKLPDRLKDSGLTPRGSESDRGFSLMQKKLGTAPSSIHIVYSSKNLDLTSEKQKNAILQSLNPLKKKDYVERIQLNQTSRLHYEKGIQLVVVELNLKSSDALNHFPEIRKLIVKPPGMKTYVDGDTATLYDIQRATKQDMHHSEMIGLPVALLVLLFIFGTVWAALIPLIIGMMSVSLTLGMTYFLSDFYSLSNFLPNIVMMLGLAIGVDYALFLVSRFREELRLGNEVPNAVAMAAQTAGKSVFFSGFAVLIGMFGMLFIKLPIIYSLCLGGVLVVFSAVTLSCTLLPALLGIFGRHINSLKVFPRTQKKWESSTVWERIANAVMKRPAVLAIIISTLLLSLMLPITRMRIGVPTADVLPPSFESRMGSEILKNNYDKRKSNPIFIVLKTKDKVEDESTIRMIQSYENKIRRTPGVMEVSSFIDALGKHSPKETSILLSLAATKEQMEKEKLVKGNYTLLKIVPKSDPGTAVAADLVKRMRKVKINQAEHFVTGQTALRVDMLDRIFSGLPYLMWFIIAVTYLILLYAFKSVLIPLKAVVMNILSLGASLGIVVIIFQYGWLADDLRITSTGYVSIIMPVTIFCIVFGISMDYEVFLISRIKEEYDQTGDNNRSTAVGLQKTGSLISSAALILMVVVGSFIFTNIEITKALGVGLFCAIFIDATLIRIIVVPALMKLLGPANWWAPKWMWRRS
ncbi:MMPL family transporter [Neobacillus niacini]|uniref:MMPL family transporter n=1 Tax=Neobacillus niacini TaxID=86668 RepID=UPI002861B850|nr:MMPL family transporter [Neobacillus niacini]MDR7000279.1 RND superfamily putative drug exporter [Neobacillus niacini]